MALSYPPDTFSRQKWAQPEIHARGDWADPSRPGKACVSGIHERLPAGSGRMRIRGRGRGKEEQVEITLAAVEEARRTVSGAILRTPMLPAPRLSAMTGAEVFIKYENLQVTGSFKERGALAKLMALSAAARAKGVIAMSAGNHAPAGAYHAGLLKTPATLVIPAATPSSQVSSTEHYGAEGVLEGQSLGASPTRP